MDILDILRRDHEVIRSLFDRYDALGPRSHAERRAAFEEIREELEAHRSAEEEFLYRAIRETRAEKASAHLNEGFEEHRIVERLIDEISLLTNDDRTLPVKFTVLRENVEHHLREEEGDLFEEARATLTAESREELGLRVEARREAVRASLA